MNPNHKYIIKNTMVDIISIMERINKDKFDNMNQFLIKYCIIRSCATIEVILKDMLFIALTKEANSQACKFLEKNIKDASFNPKFGTITKLLEQMDSIWAKKLEDTFKRNDKAKYKGSLGSIVSLRNEIAHTGILSKVPSIESVVKYYNDSIIVITALNFIMGHNDKYLTN